MFLVYFLLWIIFNERVTLEVALIGLIVCAAVDLFSVKILGKLPRKKLKTCLRLTVGVVEYGAIGLISESKLNYSGAVTQIYEYERAEIALLLHPAHDAYPLTDVCGRKLGTVCRALILRC